jgi:flagellar basal-body rod protein FlgC
MSISAITHTALSGMLAQTARAGAAAGNIANLGTPGYGRLNAGLSPVEPNGVAAAVATTDQPVDLAAGLIDLVETGQGYRANAAVFETGADLWDVLATVKRD